MTSLANASTPALMENSMELMRFEDFWFTLEIPETSKIVKAVFTLAKLSTIMPVTATRDSHHCSCLGHLGQRDTDRIVYI